MSSLSIKLRLTYNSFDDSMGSLLHQLAQPDASQAVPSIGDMFKDLADGFSQLVAGAGQSDQLSLNGFLTALAGSFAAPKASPAAAEGASALPSSSEPTTPEASSTISTVSQEAAPTAPSTPKAFVAAMARYEQVSSLGNQTTMSMLQISMSQTKSLEMA